MWQFADLRRTQLFFVDLKFPQNHYFSPFKYKLKMLSFQFKGDFWLLGYPSFETELHCMSKI
jgi:hypothetical protein